MEDKEKKESYFSAFPAAELGKMIAQLDRFDTEVPTEEKKILSDAIEKAEEVSEKIIEENL